MEDPEVEIAEEADISLNGSICDSMSTFGGGDARYRDFDDDKAQNISLKSFATASSEDRFEGSEEPRLKYDRLASDIKDILAHDTASAFAVHDKFIVVGTNWGKLYLLDALGHMLPHTQSHFGNHSHSVAVSQISIDHDGEHVASCSTDGRVMITGLYTTEHNHSISTGKPVYSVSIDPIYGREGSGKRFMIGDDQRVILFERGGILNRYKQTALSDGTDGPIRNIKWRGRFAAWTSRRGVVVYDVVQEKTISIIRLGSHLPGEDQGDICTRVQWSDQKSLFVSHGHTIRVCNIRRRDNTDAIRLRDLPHYLVEIVHTINLECFWICGLAPMDRHIVLLVMPKVKNDEELDENKPQLMVVEPLVDDFHEISTDYLCLKDYEQHPIDDLHLEYLLEDKHYFIVSPKDIFFGKPRDEDDHIDWLLLQEQFEKALSYAESHVRKLKRHTLHHVGRQYLDHLLDNDGFDTLGPLYTRIFKGNKKFWESEVVKMKGLNRIDAIGPYVPLGPEKNQLKLDAKVYEEILFAFLKLEVRKDEVMLELIRDWPIGLYDLSKVVKEIIEQLLDMPENQTLQRCLATLFSHQRRYDKAMAMYLKLGHKDVFQLIRKHDLFGAIDDKIVQLMDLDHKDALKLFLEHPDKLSPENIVERLSRSSRNLYFYLDALCQKDWETSKKFHGFLVGLYADYAPEKLLRFLKNSDNYPIQEALETCTNHVRELVDERIYILARMDNTKEALRLITSENYDIHKAVEFCKEYDDVDLWHDLIDFSIDKPYFVHVLLHNIGTHVDPRILIERIEAGREIPGLRDSLVQIMHDYQLQVTLQEGCNKILVSDCFTLLERQFHNISRGLYSHKETQCGGCGGRIVLRPTQDSSSSSSSSIPSHSESSIYCDTFVFNCKHAFHIECLPADDHHNKEDFMTTNCSLCTSSKKKRF